MINVLILIFETKLLYDKETNFIALTHHYMFFMGI